jgi:hypothetical protein
MSKPVIWALVVVGFLFFLMGLAVSKFLLFLGLILLGAGLWLGLGPDGILRNDQVVDSWGLLIEGAQGRAEEIFRNTDSSIRDSKAPALEMERKAVSPGIIRGLIGVSRDFLVVTGSQNLRMKPYQIYLNARDYGDNLDVSWYLTYKPTLLQAAVSLIPFVSAFPTTLAALDLFDQQDLRAYSTVVHHSTMKSVEKIMLDLHQDPSKVERKSRGFLGIS